MIWLTVLFPLFGAVLNGFFMDRLKPKVAHILGAAAIFCSFLCALGVVFPPLMKWAETGTFVPVVYYGLPWIKAGSLDIGINFLIDEISAMMLLVVTGIGTLIHVYAGGYLHEEKTLYRFFAYLNLFVFMMLILVLGSSLPLLFVGWEGVGLCSYLLIGYWYEDLKNADAGMKAFVVNRVGDLGFLVGMFLLWNSLGSLDFLELKRMIAGQTSIDPAVLSSIQLATLALFIGACGKSAQIPLYVWLPDAMAGPTPVSALIHAATMVTAGIYMMTKLSFLFYLSPGTMCVIASVGCATAFFAATMAIVQRDIKKVLAYSTVSQLGYMVMACGVGAFDAGVFHLLTHACFKALLFLGAGSVIYAMHHEQDMFHMGGLKSKMPVTYIVFLIGLLAIIGFPGLAGFFSKDEILWRAFIFPGKFGTFLWAMGVLTAICTAFYMTRLFALTFLGTSRDKHHHYEHAHETPSHMWIPLVVLAFLSVFIGYLGVPNFLAESFGFHNFFEEYLANYISIPEGAGEFWAFKEEHHPASLEWSLMIVSTSLCMLSAWFAWFLYGGQRIHSMVEETRKSFNQLYNLLSGKYWVDEVYEMIVVKPLKMVSFFLWGFIDVVILNGIILTVGQGFKIISAILSIRNTGSIHRHVLGMCLALAVLFIVLS